MKSTKSIIITLLSSAFFSCGTSEIPEDAQLLVNHLGYIVNSPKQFVLQTKSADVPKHFYVENEDGKVVFKGKMSPGGPVDGWHTGKAYVGDFSALRQEGRFVVALHGKSKKRLSSPFEISENRYSEACLPLLIEGFKSARPAEKYEKWDSSISFFGERDDRVDAHGGWYDASGDYSKYLSHLNYANYFSPQQTPIVVWAMLRAAGQPLDKEVRSALLAESAYGADFLRRMFDAESHYFYTTIFDNWSKDESRREICAYRTQNGIRTDEYQAAFREGAGLSIAALAAVARSGVDGDFSSEDYLLAAEQGFAHLLVHNAAYCDDGKENIIDDYCSLLAATELFKTTKKQNYLEVAREKCRRLAARQVSDSNFRYWWSANDDASRPYFHAAEAGFPLIALAEYLEIEHDENLRLQVVQTIQNAVDFELAITAKVHNPFTYPRQYVKAANEDHRRDAFFIPHNNETGYWWQGENARLASLATALSLSRPHQREDQQDGSRHLAAGCINWILGLNPYDICMLQGVGHNNPEYETGNRSWNYDGGVANGITAGFEDEKDIAFLPPKYAKDYAQNWRWSEQWIPHGAWLILALTTF